VNGASASTPAATFSAAAPTNSANIKGDTQRLRNLIPRARSAFSSTRRPLANARIPFALSALSTRRSPRPIGSEVTRARNYSHSSGHDAIIRGCYEGVTYEIFPNTFSTNTLIAYLPSLSSDVTRARDDVNDTETTFRARDDVGDA
jgi:hypothetical protein